MHEQGVAQELVAEVDRVVRAHLGSRASRVVVRVPAGALEEESFRVAFDLARQATTAAAAELAVEHVALDGYCFGCGSVVSVENVACFACPVCGSGTWRPSGARSVTLASVEIEV